MAKSLLSIHMFLSVVRIAGMGGKFIFTLAAMKSMTPDEFGRFGLITAGIWMGVMVVGLEVSSVLLRDMITSEDGRARKLRGFYVSYAVMAGLVSLAIAWTISIVADFGTWLATLVAIAMFLEYFSTELTRLLVACDYPARGSIAMFCRGGLWCYLLVGCTIVGLAPAQWSLSMVMIVWILSDLLILGFLGVLWPNIDLEPRVFLTILQTIRGLLRQTYPFLVSTIGFQFLLSGGRFFVAYFDSEALSGRFTLLSTIASVNLTMVKGICEHLYFAKVVGKDRAKHWNHFVRSVYAFTVGSTLVTLLAVPVYNKYAGKSLTAMEYQSLGLLLVAYVALCLSVISKFQLYSAGKDRALMICTAMAVMVFVVSAVILTPLFGLNGASLATALGAATLPIGQSIAGKKIRDDVSEVEGDSSPSTTTILFASPTPQANAPATS